MVFNLYCKNCGYENDADASFCEKCGVNLSPSNSQKPSKGMSTTNKILIVAVIVLIAGVGISAGALLTSNTPKQPIVNNSTPQNTTSTEIQTTPTTTTPETITTSPTTKEDSKYLTWVCRKCGKYYKVPKYGEQLYYCDECVNSPEIQQLWYEENSI